MQASSFHAPQQAYSKPRTLVARAMAAAILVPLSRTIEILGMWPKLMAKLPHPGGFGDYQPTAADVIVCSYFKSGTTWALQMAIQIAHRGQAEFDNLHYAVAWPDAPGNVGSRIIALDDLSPVQMSPTGLRIIKSHLPADKVPFAKAAKYVALVRDPKDVCVSGHHFMKALVGRPFPSLLTWIEMFLSPAFNQGNWARHLASYWSIRERPNLIFLTYEDTKADPAGTVDKIAKLMGVVLSPEEKAAVVERSTMAWMKAHRSKFDPGRVLPWSSDEVTLVRKGQVGGSETELTAEQRVRIDRHFLRELEELDCDFPYERLYAVT